MSPAASRIATFGLSSSCCCTRSTVLHPPILHNQAAIPIAFSPQVLYLRRQNGKKMLILPNYRNHHHPLRPCSVNDNQDSQTKESSDISLPEQTDSTGKENHQQESLTTNEGNSSLIALLNETEYQGINFTAGALQECFLVVFGVLQTNFIHLINQEILSLIGS